MFRLHKYIGRSMRNWDSYTGSNDQHKTVVQMVTMTTCKKYELMLRAS